MNERKMRSGSNVVAILARDPESEKIKLYGDGERVAINLALELKKVGRRIGNLDSRCTRSFIRSPVINKQKESSFQTSPQVHAVQPSGPNHIVLDFENSAL